MSRVGKNPVVIPNGVDASIERQDFAVKGPLGEMRMTLVPEVEAKIEDARVVVKPRDASTRARAMWGMSRSLVASMVTGVSEGFTIDLEITGVGYRAQLEGNALKLQLGYSHDVLYPIPPGITIKCEKPTMIKISGADKQKVGQVAAQIRGYRRPDPYKAKGIRYAGERIRRKEGKKK